MCSILSPQEAKPEKEWCKEWPQVLAQPCPLVPSPWPRVCRHPASEGRGWRERAPSELSAGCSALWEVRPWDTMEEEGIYVCLTFAPNPLPDAVAEKTKEQASHLGGAVFSGAGNIAAATGLVKKEEFPTDLKVSYPSNTYTHTHTSYTHKSATRLPAPPASLGNKPPRLTFCRAGIHTARPESACGCVWAWRSP